MGKKSLPLHTKIFIGLFSGLIAGLLCNIFFKGDKNIEWIVSNIAYPVVNVTGDIVLTGWIDSTEAIPKN